MHYQIDRMTIADIPRVAEVERLAYASPWPTSAYRKELQENRWAHYIVVRDTRLRATLEADTPPAELPQPRRLFPLSLLPARQSTSATHAARASIVGFAGLWLMLDDAHVTTIATHPDYRGHHVGELLLASLVDIAYTIGATHVTLEVRVSNSIAQNLYRKYGFQQTGLRRRYYSDNQEDALLMATNEIRSPDYRDQFQRLKAVLATTLEAEDSATPPASAAAPNTTEPDSRR